MVFALDTLGYAKHLRDHGVPSDQAEAHAEAARDFRNYPVVPPALPDRGNLARVAELAGFGNVYARRLTHVQDSRFPSIPTGERCFKSICGHRVLRLLSAFGGSSQAVATNSLNFL